MVLASTLALLCKENIMSFKIAKDKQGKEKIGHVEIDGKKVMFEDLVYTEDSLKKNELILKKKKLESDLSDLKNEIDEISGLTINKIILAAIASRKGAKAIEMNNGNIRVFK